MKSKSKILFGILGLLVIGLGTFAGVYFALNKEKVDKPIVQAYYEVGEIFVNLSDEGAKRYVKLNLSFGYDMENKDLAVELEEKKVVIKDTANYYLKSCKAKDFEPSNENVLKMELVKRLNTKLTSGVIIDAYVSEIMVQ